MNIPENLKFTKSHEWVKELPNGNVQVGISDYAQGKLGDIVFVNLCNVGDKVEAGEMLGDVESIKAVSSIYAPVSGVAVNINQEILDNPALINSSAYESWFVELKNVGAKELLLSPNEYKKIIEADV